MNKIRWFCPSCNKPRLLRPCDAKRNDARGSVCRSCHSRSAGKAGYAATVGKYGPDFFLEVCQRTQGAKPSRPEARVRSWLEEMGAQFDAQAIIPAVGRNFVVDFLLSNGTVIEVNGYWHKQTGQERDRQLAARWNYQVVFVDADRVITQPEAVRAELSALVAA